MVSSFLHFVLLFSLLSLALKYFEDKKRRTHTPVSRAADKSLTSLQQHLLGRLRSNRLRHTLPLLRRLPNSLPTPTRLVPRSRRPRLLRHRHRQPFDHNPRTPLPALDQLPQTRPRNRRYTSRSHGICNLHCSCESRGWRIVVCMDLHA